MNEREQQAVLTISLMAAFADGAKGDLEQEQIKRIADGLGKDINLPALYQDVILKRRTLEEVAADLTSHESRQLAYEMAVCVCDADEARSTAEQAFLEKVRATLQLEPQVARAFADQSAGLAATPISSGKAGTTTPVSVDVAVLDKSILNYSILNGALELLPESLASMAILPLQMKMVYSVGKAYGYELDRGHIKDFAATLGVGITGQYVEQVGRKLIGGLLKAIGGSMVGGLGKAAVSLGFSFATTYALGMVAKQYYSAGRTIDMQQLKQVFASLIEQGKSLQTRYATEIQQKARSINVSDLAGLVRGQ